MLAAYWQIEQRGKAVTDNPDVPTITIVLALRVEELKKDKDALAAVPDLLVRLAQYRENKGLKHKWCPDCYIIKKTETLGPPMPMGPSGELRATYTCGECNREYEARRP